MWVGNTQSVEDRGRANYYFTWATMPIFSWPLTSDLAFRPLDSWTYTRCPPHPFAGLQLSSGSYIISSPPLQAFEVGLNYITFLLLQMAHRWLHHGLSQPPWGNPHSKSLLLHLYLKSFLLVLLLWGTLTQCSCLTCNWWLHKWRFYRPFCCYFWIKNNSINHM